MTGVRNLCHENTLQTAAAPHHPPDDRFIPVAADDVLRALCDDVERFGACTAELPAVAEALRGVVDQEAAAFERDLSALYSPFNADRDTLLTADDAARRTADGYGDLYERLDYTLRKANFEPLDSVQVDSAVRLANSYGLRVRLRPDRVEHLSLWVRGRTVADRWVRTWRRPIRCERRVVPVYRRLAVAARLRDEPYVALKLFKDIPVADIEALLPHAEVTMSWFDQLKVWGGGAGALGSTATKLFTTAATLVAFSKLLWVVTLGLAAMAVRTALGYRRARINRDWQRTRHLYYQNLSNNAGVLHSVIDMIAQEELKEALLAYTFCLAEQTPPRDAGELRRRIESWMYQRFGVRFDFDVQDGIETLTRLELWSDAAALRVIPPALLCRKLEEHWRARRSLGYHGERIVAHLSKPA